MWVSNKSAASKILKLVARKLDLRDLTVSSVQVGVCDWLTTSTLPKAFLSFCRDPENRATPAALPAVLLNQIFYSASENLTNSIPSSGTHLGWVRGVCSSSA